MENDTITTDFGQFVFLDNNAVVATAYDKVIIDKAKIKIAIDLIEHKLTGDYGLILERKLDYSIIPVEAYSYFSSLKRLKAIAIVKYRERDFLPEGMEKRIFKRDLEKFTSIDDAHKWISHLLNKSK